MALRSPRFQFEPTLVKVDGNQTVLQKGSTGTPVHLVQMALLDLGVKMPISTAHPNNSPDGVFGEETRQAIMKFQHDHDLKDDGIIGPKTLQALDVLFPNFTHRVKLHFRSIALTNVPFQRSLTNAEIVYAQYGIKIEFGSGESILLTDEQREKFDQIDQECNWDLDSGEFNELQGLGTPRAEQRRARLFRAHVRRQQYAWLRWTRSGPAGLHGDRQRAGLGYGARSGARAAHFRLRAGAHSRSAQLDAPDLAIAGHDADSHRRASREDAKQSPLPPPLTLFSFFTPEFRRAEHNPAAGRRAA